LSCRVRSLHEAKRNAGAGGSHVAGTRAGYDGDNRFLARIEGVTKRSLKPQKRGLETEREGENEDRAELSALSP
jgi:hypothetical protein